MTVSDTFSEFCFEIVLDTILPLGTGTYSIEINGAIKKINISQCITGRQNLGSLEAHGVVCANPQSNGAIGNGQTRIIISYELPSPLSIDEFASCFRLSPIWHLSPSGWAFILDELNRIIDLYRAQQEAYWWNHLGMWNIDELKITGTNPNAGQSRLILLAWPKMFSFGGRPYDAVADAPESSYVTNVTNDVKVPFYFVLYLNGRRAFGEHNLREAKINFANSLEAFAALLLRLAGHSHSMDRKVVEALLISLSDHRQKLSKAYHLLGNCGFSPSLSKKRLMKLVEVVMEHRNDVMHGSNPRLSWDNVALTQSALSEILGVQPEVEQFLKNSKQRPEMTY